MTFAAEMLAFQRELEGMGYTCLLPYETEQWATGELDHLKGESDEARQELIARVVGYDLIRRHFGKIAVSAAILVLNLTKGGVKNYIGANTFLEIGFAYALGLPVNLLNEPPDMPYIGCSITRIQPVVLYGNLHALRVRTA